MLNSLQVLNIVETATETRIMSLHASQESGPSRVGAGQSSEWRPWCPVSGWRWQISSWGQSSVPWGDCLWSWAWGRGQTGLRGYAYTSLSRAGPAAHHLYAEQTPTLVERFYYRCPILSTLGTR